MKKISRRNFVAVVSTAIVAGAGGLDSGLTGALAGPSVMEKPLYTPRNITMLFAKGSRGQDLTAEQVNALVEEAVRDVRGFLIERFEMTEVQEKGVSSIPQENIDKIADLLRKIPSEEGKLNVQFIEKSKRSEPFWIVEVITPKTRYRLDMKEC